MKILMILYYYYPYVSGISEYAKRISEGLVKHGHKVTVLTSKHEKNLKSRENINGVEIVRCQPIFEYSKGPIMPTFLFKGYRMARKYDVVNVHVPLVEAGIFSSILPNCVITYHCDVRLNSNPVNKMVETLYYYLTNYALRRTKAIITNTEDYAKHSKLLKNYLPKCNFIFPPIDETRYKHTNSSRFVEKHGLKDKKVIGFVGRIVYEKGIDYLLDAIPLIRKRFKNIKVVIAGDYENVAGGSIMDSLSEKISSHNEDLLFLGKIPHETLLEFYSACDVLVLPSIDPLESFGMVQIESMYCGTPVVAADLPGVRLPVQLTGMGLIAKSKDSGDLAENIIKIIKNRGNYVKERQEIKKHFSIGNSVEKYSNLFQKQQNIRKTA